jgi:hypothetical protein
MAVLGLEVLFGQIAANLVRTDVEKYIDQNYDTARDLALSREVEAELRQKFPRLRAIIRTDKDVSFFPPDPELHEIPEWSTPGSRVLLQVGDKVMIAAHAQEKPVGHTVDVFVYTPSYRDARANLTRSRHPALPARKRRNLERDGEIQHGWKSAPDQECGSANTGESRTSAATGARILGLAGGVVFALDREIA